MHNIIDVNARERALLKSLALSSLPSGDSESLEEVVTDLENPSPLRKYPTMYNQLSNKSQNGEEKYLGSSSVKATKGEKATQEMLQSEEDMPLSARGIFTSVVDENIAGPSNIPQLRVDSGFVQKQRVGGIVEEIKATGLGQAIDQTLTRSFDHEYIDAAKAERMSKEAGLDIKFEEGRYKKSEVSQRIENTYRKRLRDSNLAQYQSEPDPTFLNKAQIFGAAVGTGMFGTPWDTVGTAALMFAPELIVGGIAKTAGAVNTATKANAVLNASSKIARAKTSASMFRAAASNVDDTGLRTYARYRMKRNLTGSIKTPRVSPGVAKTLENLSALKYNNLTGTEKTLLDTAVFGIGDIPIAGFKYYNDQEIGSNLYTAKDAMSEVLYAGALGAVVPGALRGVGKAIGIYPKDIAIRRINEASNEIKYKAAMGEISQEDANEALKTLDNIKKATENDAKNVKDIHPSLAQAAEELPRVNLDNDTLHTWITVIANDIAQGRGIPKISQLPQGKHAFSHIAFDFVARLKQESIGKVLGKHLLVNKTKFGSHTVTVNGETGALGGKAAFGATLEDAQTFLESLYKGFVLEDADALERAYEHYFRGQDFLDELNKIYDKYSEMRAANQEKFTYSAKKLINLEEALGDAYIKYRWGAETLEGLKAREENLKIAKEEGRAAQDATLSREDSAMQEEAKAFVEKYVYVTEKEVENKEGAPTKKRLYDFKEENGDKGDKFFRAFKKDLEEGISSNEYLMGLDEAMIEIGENRLKEYLEYVKEGLYAPDTDLNRILGAPIRSFEDLRKMDDDAVAWQKELNIQSIRFEQKKSSEMYSEISEQIEKYASSDKHSFALYKPIKDIYDKISNEKKTKYVEVKNRILKTLREDSGIKRGIDTILSNPDKGNKRSLNFIKKRLKEILSAELNEGNINKVVKTSDITRRVIDSFMSKVEKDPDILSALLNVENLEEVRINQALYKENARNTGNKRLSEIDDRQKEIRSQLEELDSGKRYEKIRSKANKIRDEHRALQKEKEEINIPDQPEVNTEDDRLRNADVFLAPLTSLLDLELSRVQLQIVNDMNIFLDKAYLMQKHPHIAKEILIGGATQTIYNFRGSNRSIENARKSASIYKNAVLNELDKEESVSGGTLKEYALRESSKKDIFTALVKLKHGEDLGSSNSDAERVAKILHKHEATLNSTMSVFGSNYTSPMDVIDPQKFKYFDAGMTPESISEMKQRTNIAEQLNKDFLKEKLYANNEMKYNDELYTDVAKIEEMLKGTVDDLVDTMNSFFDIRTSLHSKTALYIFKNMDLDKMIGEEGSLAFNSFNGVRDAILDNNWEELLDGDYANLVDAVKDLKTIRTKLLGDKGEYRFDAESTAWVVRYLTGQGSTAARDKGIPVPYLDAYRSRFYFKNAEEELKASLVFGYDDVFQAFDANTQRIINAKHVLETYGSNPENMCRDLVSTYESIRGNATQIKDRNMALAKKLNVNMEERFGISEDDADSALGYISHACGLQNCSASGWVRFWKATAGIVTSTMLMKAGFKSLADHGTIMQGLINNALAEGRIEAASVMGRAMNLMAKDKDIFRMVSAAAIIQEEDLLQKMTNNPFLTLKELSENLTGLDRYESIARTIQDISFNKLAHITDFTNYNKQVAGMSIQMAMGKRAGEIFKSLPKSMQLQLNRESIDEIDWNMFQKFGFSTLTDGQGDFKVFDPLTLNKIPDKAIEKALRAKGELNISKNLIDKYRSDLQGKGITLIDSASDEMVSLPSERTMARVRLKQKRGSGAAAFVELFTQFQSFGASLVYNTYGRTIANNIAGESGIRVLDQFNPLVRMSWALRNKNYECLANAFITVGVAMTLVDSTVEMLTGRIEKPIKEDGTINKDLLFKRTVAPLGIGGVFLDSIWEAVEGTGQGAGGIAWHAFPALSRITRTVSNLKRPLESKSVENKGQAFAAAFGQELASMAGLKSFPVVALVYQAAIGSWLDMLIKGGPEDYREMIRGRERRGLEVFEWERNPKPGNFPALLGL